MFYVIKQGVEYFHNLSLEPKHTSEGKLSLAMVSSLHHTLDCPGRDQLVVAQMVFPMVPGHANLYVQKNICNNSDIPTLLGCTTPPWHITQRSQYFRIATTKKSYDLPLTMISYCLSPLLVISFSGKLNQAVYFCFEDVSLAHLFIISCTTCQMSGDTSLI